MKISAENAIATLNLMWKGMLAIFIAIGVIWLAVLAMAKLGARAKRKKAEAAAAAEKSAADETPSDGSAEK